MSAERRRKAAALEVFAGADTAEVAKRYGVARRTIQLWCKRYRETDTSTDPVDWGSPTASHVCRVCGRGWGLTGRTDTRRAWPETAWECAEHKGAPLPELDVKPKWKRVRGRLVRIEEEE